MSFIYKEFYQELLKKAQQAQPVPAADPAATSGSISEYAKQLISNLEQQVGTFTSERENAELNTKNLTSLDQLLYFLSYNDIKYGGAAIVVKTNSPGEVEFQTLSDTEKSQYFTYPSKENPEYYINKNLLIRYLQSLLNKNNPVLNALINQRIAEANSKLLLGMKPTQIDNRADKSSSFYKDQGGNDASSNQQKQKSDASKANLTKVLREMEDELPFLPNQIDFARINRFMTAYRSILDQSVGVVFDGSRTSEVNRQIQSVIEAMQETAKHTKNQISKFDVSSKMSPDMFKVLLKDPQAQHYIPLVEALKNVIQSTKAIVQDLFDTYANSQLLDASTINKISAQIEGNSLFNQNWNTLSLLERSFLGK